MRINRYVASASGIGRRAADKLITEGRVKVDGQLASTAQDVQPNQQVTLDGKLLELPKLAMTIMLNKPTGYVVSREGQGAPTIYSLLPDNYHKLKPIGRLDKDSSGLLLMSNDGQLINSLAHPSFNKEKVYEVTLDKVLSESDKLQIKHGVKLDDGLSRLSVLSLEGKKLVLSMEEGRNRQIRRTFSALGYSVTKLNRIAFGEYHLGNLTPGNYREVKA